MTGGVMYQQIFRYRAFRSFWLGFTLSVLGDTMARVALTWYVYDFTRSSEALGLLALAYTGPVIIGGLIAGPLLDRFGTRRVMIADNVLRSMIMLAIPLLHALDALALWHIYAAATVYGALMMISLAGSPALIPDLVAGEHLSTANALETLSYTLSGVVGPPLAGLLIPLISAPNVVILDAVSYFVFALALLSLPHADSSQDSTGEEVVSYSLMDAVRLLLHNPVLLSTTLMFMAFNLGFGALMVWLPILSDQVLHGGPELYGLLLGVLALGEVLSSFLAGALRLPFSLGMLICGAQALSGLALLILIGLSIPAAVVSLTLVGFFSAPLTIWAQTLRMKVIPPMLRGRTFALLRTLMQSAHPLGGAAAGVVFPLLTMPLLVALSAACLGLPGLLGLSVRALPQAD
jgi:MFS family permease